MSILFKGKSYNSLEEMPIDERRQFEESLKKMKAVFEDNDGNGLPDVVDKGLLAALLKSTGEGDRIGKIMAGIMDDRNANGIPDVMERGGNQPASGVSTRWLILDGKEYDRPEEMPAGARDLYERAMKRRTETTNLSMPAGNPLSSVPVQQPTPQLAPLAYKNIEPDEGLSFGTIVLVLVATGIIAVSAFGAYLLLR